MVIKLSSYQVIKGECVPQAGGWAEESGRTATQGRPLPHFRSLTHCFDGEAKEEEDEDEVV